MTRTWRATMTISTQFGFSDPDKVACTLAVTMTLKEWKFLRSRLDANDSGSIYYFKASIAGVIEKAEQKFFVYESALEKKA